MGICGGPEVSPPQQLYYPLFPWNTREEWKQGKKCSVFMLCSLQTEGAQLSMPSPSIPISGAGIVPCKHILIPFSDSQLIHLSTNASHLNHISLLHCSDSNIFFQKQSLALPTSQNCTGVIHKTESFRMVALA